MTKGCQILFEKDLRLPALVSLLKAAHLTLFEMLGYRYALSPGGLFLGRTVLGDFFLQNRNRSRADILRHADAHFRQFANMARPVLDNQVVAEGTVADQLLFVCFCEDRSPWSLIVFVRTSDLLHAVLVPVFQVPSAAARFEMFLQGEGGPIQANGGRFKDDKFEIGPTETLIWPKAEF